MNWFSILGRGRSERTTTEQQIFARNALARLAQRRREVATSSGRGDDH